MSKHSTTYPGFDSWHRAAALAYVLADGAFLCPDCANRENGSCASVDPDTDPQWRIVGSQSAALDPEASCAHCYRQLSTYVPALKL